MPGNEQGRPMRVLVVDDDDDLSSIYCEILTEHGYEPLRAATAQEALAAWKSYFPLDLVLVDYSLPEMNGQELVIQLREKHADELAGIPLAVFSSHSSNSPIADAVRAAGAQFWEKTGSINEFVKVVEELITKKRL